jgi:hypothetical protein
VHMNLTLSVDEKTVERARQVAKAQGTSLNSLIRQYLQSLAGESEADELVAKLDQLWEDSPGNSGGKQITRADAYLERVG